MTTPDPWDELKRLRDANAQLVKLYNDLLYDITRKHPEEVRYKTYKYKYMEE